MSTRILLLAFIFACLSGVHVSAQSFSLSDSGLSSTEFRERFLGSYGVNAAIEPEITQADKPLYEKIVPFLREDLARAAEELKAGMTVDSSPAFDFLLGNLLYQQGNYSEAERALGKAIERFPDFRRAYRTLGFIQVQAERYAESIDTWLKVISLGGGDAQSYGLLAYAYLTLEKYQSALSAYEMGRIFKPDSLDFRRGQAQSLLALGRNKEAVALFDELIAENPESAEFWLLQANVYLEQERYEDAIANLEVLRGTGQATRSALLLLANLHLQNDNHLLALQAYREVLEKHGFESVENSLRPLEYLVGRGLFPEAASYLGTLQTVLPRKLSEEDTVRLAVARAGLAMEQGDLSDAMELLEPIVTANPLNGGALLLLAEAQRRDQSHEEAEFHIQRALSLPEKKYEALVALGRLKVDQGDFEAALVQLREAELMQSSPSLVRYIEAIAAAR